MFRKKKPTFIIAFDATTQAMATDKFCTKNGLPGRLFYTYFRNLIYKHSTLSIYFSEFIFINMSYFRYSNSSMSLQTTY